MELFAAMTMRTIHIWAEWYCIQLRDADRVST